MVLSVAVQKADVVQLVPHRRLVFTACCRGGWRLGKSFDSVAQLACMRMIVCEARFVLLLVGTCSCERGQWCGSDFNLAGMWHEASSSWWVLLLAYGKTVAMVPMMVDCLVLDVFGMLADVLAL